MKDGKVTIQLLPIPKTETLAYCVGVSDSKVIEL